FNATLTLSTDVTNHGTIRLESIDSSWNSNIAAAGHTLTNASDGTLQVNRGTAGGRTITGNLINQGTVAVTRGITLVSDVSGGATVRLAGGSVAPDASSAFLAQNGTVALDGGTLGGAVLLRSAALVIGTGSTATGTVTLQGGGNTLAGDVQSGQ